MTNTTNQKDSSAASGELVGEVKKDRSTGIPYIDWKRDHTLLPVGFKLYGARAPQAATPLPGLDERVLFESALAASFPDLPKREDAIASNAKVIGYAMFQAGIAQGRSIQQAQQAAPAAPTDRQNMTRAEMLALCAANPASASGLPLKYPVAAGDSTAATQESDRVVWWPLGPYAEQRAPAPSREAAPLDEIRSAASDLLKYLDDHDWGGIPEGATADRLRAAIAQQAAPTRPNE